MKNFFKNIGRYFKEHVFVVLKNFFSKWTNIILFISLICTIVFLSLYRFEWCRITGYGFLALTIGMIAYSITIYSQTFVHMINKQKQELLQELADKFDKEEYLSLDTPFNPDEEKVIQEKIKQYKQIQIVCWVVFALLVYLFIAQLI